MLSTFPAWKDSCVWCTESHADTRSSNQETSVRPPPPREAFLSSCTSGLPEPLPVQLKEAAAEEAGAADWDAGWVEVEGVATLPDLGLRRVHPDWSLSAFACLRAWAPTSRTVSHWLFLSAAALTSTLALWGIASAVMVIELAESPQNLCSQNSRVSPLESYMFVMFPALNIAVCAPVTLWLAFVAVTPHLKATGLFADLVLALHASMWLTNLNWCMEREDFSDYNRPWFVSRSWYLVQTSLALVFEAASLLLVLGRVQALERSSLQSFGSRRLKVLLVALALYSIGIPVFTAAKSDLYQPADPERVFFSCFLALWCVLNASGMYSLVTAYRLAKTAGDNAPLHRRTQSLGAVSAISAQVWGVFWLTLTNAVKLITNIAEIFAEEPQSAGLVKDLRRVYIQLVWLVDSLANMYFVLALSGSLSGAARGAATRSAASKRRLDHQRQASAAWYHIHDKKRPSLLLDACPAVLAWDDKVFDLAGRGITLQALLDFYRVLDQLMPHFDAALHTTADVVRHAIIPYTSSQRCSCSKVLMKGEYRRPQRMVTHNWGNIFRDLVAAVLADALSELDFSMIAALLSTDLDLLERWVRDCKVGSRTYWICAFAVNQHLGVCASNPARVLDTVTNELYPVCRCGLQKAWNDTPPLDHDGRSLACEMNKFDDMMRYLSATDPDFEQIVAVDSEFKIFTRAWCIAEIAAAKEVGMLQSLKFWSEEKVASNAEKLRTLRIQDMESARPEDKEQILSNIEDLPFNIFPLNHNCLITLGH